MQNTQNRLTAKQEAFCQEYLISLNATQAYIKVYGTKERTARVQGSVNLTKPSIQARLKELMEAKNSSLIAKQDEVLQFLTKTMRGEITQEQVVIEGSGEGVSTASKIDVKVPSKERVRAAELLGKRYGIFNENLVVKDERPIIKDDI